MTDRTSDDPRRSPDFPPALILRPLTLDDEHQARVAHQELLTDNFTFLLGYHETVPWPRYVEVLQRERRGQDLPEGRVAATFLVAQVGQRIVGRASIRHELTDWLRAWGGHIGYGVRPADRRRPASLPDRQREVAGPALDQARTTLGDVEPRERPLRLYGAASERSPLPWSWVEDQLTTAGTYWVVAQTPGFPHPRPVWGIWSERRLHLSIGTPALRRALGGPLPVTVHLDSGTDVVLVEAMTSPALPGATPRTVIDQYNAKYDWDYQIAEYGELLVVTPVKILAWRSAGWAGREGFQATGCWVVERSD